MKGAEYLTIDEAYEKKENSPILIHFQNGNLNEGACGDAISGVFHDSSRRDTTRSTLISVDDSVYFGLEEEDDLCRTIIVDLDPKTGKVRLIEVGDTSVKEISCNLPTANVTDSLPIDGLALSRKFGSKKSKKILEQRERMKSKIEIVNEQVKNAVANTTVNSEDLGSYLTKNETGTYAPSINREAENIKDVYNIEDILTKEQISNIMDEVEKHDFNSELVPFLMNIMVSQNIESNWKTALVLYVNTLNNIFTVSAKDIAKKNYNPCEYSLTLSKAVLDNFTDVSQQHVRSRSIQYKDKTLCYAIVALLLVCDFRFELEPFIKAFKIPSTRLTKIVKLIGAYIVSTGPKKQVVLKIPLSNLGNQYIRRKSSKF